MIIDANIVFGKNRYQRIDCSIENVLRLIDMHKIDAALVLSLLGVFFDDVSGNDETLQICTQNKNLYPVGTIDLERFIDVDEEISKRKDQGFKAFRIFPEYHSVNFFGYRFKRFISILEKYDIPLILRGTDHGLRSYVDDITMNVCDKDIPVIILDVSGYGLAEMIEAAKFAPNIYFSTRLFTTMQSIEMFCSKVGSERLLVGSGMPVYYGFQSLLRIETSDIDDDEKENILHRNLLELMGGRL